MIPKVSPSNQQTPIYQPRRATPLTNRDITLFVTRVISYVVSAQLLAGCVACLVYSSPLVGMVLGLVAAAILFTIFALDKFYAPLFPPRVADMQVYAANSAELPKTCIPKIWQIPLPQKYNTIEGLDLLLGKYNVKRTGDQNILQTLEITKHFENNNHDVRIYFLNHKIPEHQLNKRYRSAPRVLTQVLTIDEEVYANQKIVTDSSYKAILEASLSPLLYQGESSIVRTTEGGTFIATNISTEGLKDAALFRHLVQVYSRILHLSHQNSRNTVITPFLGNQQRGTECPVYSSEALCFSALLQALELFDFYKRPLPSTIIVNECPSVLFLSQKLGLQELSVEKVSSDEEKKASDPKTESQVHKLSPPLSENLGGFDEDTGPIVTSIPAVVSAPHPALKALTETHEDPGLEQGLTRPQDEKASAQPVLESLQRVAFRQETTQENSGSGDLDLTSKTFGSQDQIFSSRETVPTSQTTTAPYIPLTHSHAAFRKPGLPSTGTHSAHEEKETSQPSKHEEGALSTPLLPSVSAESLYLTTSVESSPEYGETGTLTHSASMISLSDPKKVGGLKKQLKKGAAKLGKVVGKVAQDLKEFGNIQEPPSENQNKQESSNTGTTSGSGTSLRHEELGRDSWRYW